MFGQLHILKPVEFIILGITWYILKDIQIIFIFQMQDSSIDSKLHACMKTGQRTPSYNYNLTNICNLIGANQIKSVEISDYFHK